MPVELSESEIASIVDQVQGRDSAKYAVVSYLRLTEKAKHEKYEQLRKKAESTLEGLLKLVQPMASLDVNVSQVIDTLTKIKAEYQQQVSSAQTKQGRGSGASAPWNKFKAALKALLGDRTDELLEELTKLDFCGVVDAVCRELKEYQRLEAEANRIYGQTLDITLGHGEMVTVTIETPVIDPDLKSRHLGLSTIEIKSTTLTLGPGPASYKLRGVSNHQKTHVSTVEVQETTNNDGSKFLAIPEDEMAKAQIRSHADGRILRVLLGPGMYHFDPTSYDLIWSGAINKEPDDATGLVDLGLHGMYLRMTVADTFFIVQGDQGRRIVDRSTVLNKDDRVVSQLLTSNFGLRDVAIQVQCGQIKVGVAIAGVHVALNKDKMGDMLERIMTLSAPIQSLLSSSAQLHQDSVARGEQPGSRHDKATRSGQSTRTRGSGAGPTRGAQAALAAARSGQAVMTGLAKSAGRADRSNADTLADEGTLAGVRAGIGDVLSQGVLVAPVDCALTGQVFDHEQHGKLLNSAASVMGVMLYDLIAGAMDKVLTISLQELYNKHRSEDGLGFDLSLFQKSVQEFLAVSMPDIYSQVIDELKSSGVFVSKINGGLVKSEFDRVTLAKIDQVAGACDTLALMSLVMQHSSSGQSGLDPVDMMRLILIERGHVDQAAALPVRSTPQVPDTAAPKVVGLFGGGQPQLTLVAKYNDESTAADVPSSMTPGGSSA